jgi:MFS family permease
MEYEILAGPVFIVVYTVAGIPLGLLADFLNRRGLLAVCLALWSAMTLATGFVHEYWQLAITRFVLGIGLVN